MRIAIAIAALTAGCGFRVHEASSVDDAAPADADFAVQDARADAPPGSVCIGHFVIVCRANSLADITFDGELLDTDQDARCSYEGQGPGAPKLCVIAAHDIHVNGDLGVKGSHPLALVAFNNLNMMPGVIIDVGSHRNGNRGPGSNDGACQAASPGANGTSGGGGGAGGSLGAAGGIGGTGDLNGTSAAGHPGAAATNVIRVVGGCPGSAGGSGAVIGSGAPGAAGGGALMLLVGQKLTMPGTITAGGAGAVGASAQGGGGGGGSGGFIGIEAAMYDMPGLIAANGGGGSAGGGSVVAGAAGGDGLASASTAAPGGPPGSGGGHGGSGSAGGNRDGAIGENSTTFGGGGGGGGAGMIMFVGTIPPGGMFSPAPVSR